MTNQLSTTDKLHSIIGVEDDSDSVCTLYDFGVIYANLDRENWEYRKHFFLTMLTFCLNLGNIYRFPKQVILCDNHQFIYIYILITLVFGNVLLAFEVFVGQCMIKNFLKVFWQCPVLQGIPFAMAFSCMLLSVHYSVILVFIYLSIFPSLTTDKLEYGTCFDDYKNCSTNTSVYLQSPEYYYFTKRVVFFENNETTPGNINWRNMGVLMFVWVCMCVVIMKGIRRITWPFLVVGPIMCIVLVFTFAMTFCSKGAMYGLTHLFNSQRSKGFSMAHLVRIFEQIIVGYGIGLGPLIIHGSCSRFRSPSNIDCFCLMVITLIASLLSAAIVYCSLGIRALKYNVSVEDILDDLRKNPSELALHVLNLQLFASMEDGLSQVCSFIYFTTLFATGFLSLVWLTEIVILTLYQVTMINEKKKMFVNVCVCLSAVLLGFIFTNRSGGDLMFSIDTLFVEACLTVIVILELIIIIYIYGAFNFCDNIFLSMNFEPGFIYICLWIILPVILTINFGYSMYELSKRQITYYLYPLIFCLSPFIPIVIIAIQNFYIFYKKKKFWGVFKVPRTLSNDSLSSISEQSERHHVFFH